MGREVAHEIIKKYVTTTAVSNLLTALALEKGFPLTIDQLNNLIKDPAGFAGAALDQSKIVSKMIEKVTKGEFIKVELKELR